LLFGQSLLFHPEQILKISNNLSPCKEGRLPEKLIFEFHLELIKYLLLIENHQEKLKEYSENICICFDYRDSTNI